MNDTTNGFEEYKRLILSKLSDLAIEIKDSREESQKDLLRLREDLRIIHDDFLLLKGKLIGYGTLVVVIVTIVANLVVKYA